jgi:uncharacterized protein
LVTGSTAAGRGGKTTELEFDGVRIEKISNEPVVLLKEKQGDRYFVVDVKPAEAVAIIYAGQRARQNYALSDDPDYVLPHNLLNDLLELAGVRLTGVLLTVSRKRTFAALLTLSNEKTVSAGLPDSLALALTHGAPIVMSAKDLARVGLAISDGLADDAAGVSGPLSGRPSADAVSEPVAEAPPSIGLSRTEVVGIRQELPGGQPVVVLKEKQGGRYLVIRISAAEAAVIMLAQERAVSKPPSTHELLGEVLKAINVRIVAVSLARAADGAFFCYLVLADGRKVRARLGDSVALALRSDAEVLAADDFIDEASVLITE